MKSIVLLGLLGLVCLNGSWAAPAENPPVAILRSAVDGPNPDGSYNWSYETENGIKAEEHGELKAAQRSADNEDGQAISAQGSYSYTAPDGTPVDIKYTADENGFQPQGAVLPQAPEIPAAILKALEWIAQHPEEDNL